MYHPVSQLLVLCTVCLLRTTVAELEAAASASCGDRDAARGRQSASLLQVSGGPRHDGTSHRMTAKEAKIPVPACFYINLDERKDRREVMEAVVAEVGLNCTRVPGRTGGEKGGEHGCRLSHLAALDEIERSGAPYGLILEDDANWTVPVAEVRQVLSHLEEDMRQHPVVLLACGNGIGEAMPTPWLQEAIHCLTTSAYIVRRDYIPVLRETFKWEGAPIDQTWVWIQPSDNWVHTVPLLVHQRGGFSDILGQEAHFPH